MIKTFDASYPVSKKGWKHYPFRGQFPPRNRTLSGRVEGIFESATWRDGRILHRYVQDSQLRCTYVNVDQIGNFTGTVTEFRELGIKCGVSYADYFFCSYQGRVISLLAPTAKDRVHSSGATASNNLWRPISMFTYSTRDEPRQEKKMLSFLIF